MDNPVNEAPVKIPVKIPGEDLQLPETDLLQEIGKYFVLYQHEQKKRMILAQAYAQLKSELELKAK